MLDTQPYNSSLRIIAGSLALGAVLSMAAGCKEQVDGPQPAVTGVDPSLVCNEQLVTEVTISGESLSPLALDAATGEPRLAIPDVSVRRTQELDGSAASGEFIDLPNDPYDPAAARVRWQNETTMAFDVYPELGLAPGLYEVRVTNRNGKEATFAGALTVVPPPALAAVEPDMACLEQGMRSVTLRGQGFLSVGATLPTVTVGTADLPVDSLSDCIDLPGPTQAQHCTTAVLILPEDAVTPGPQDVVVHNPAPAGCSSEEDVTMAIVPRPSLASVEPALFCNAQAELILTLTGTGFIALREAGGAVLPQVRIGTETLPAATAENCSAVDGTLLPAESCTTLTVIVPPELTLTGEYEVVVSNPDPAGCFSEEPVPVYLAGAPVIAAIEPPAVCDIAQPTEMAVNGQGFLRVDDGNGGFTDPVVTVDGVPVAYAFVPESCTPIATTVLTGEVCTSFAFPVPAGGFAGGVHDVALVNPAPADCSANGTFGVAPAPTVTDVQPFAVCADGDSFTVTGTNFVPGSQILLSGAAVPTTYVSDTELTGTIEAGFTAGLYNVSVSNGDVCVSNELAGALNVVNAPVIYFVDPPNVYNGIAMRITVWASGIYGDSPSVGIRPTGTNDPLTILTNPAYDGDNRVQADLPFGAAALAGGDYDVVVLDDPCQAELANVLHVTENLTVELSSIEPLFGVEGERTGITIRSNAPPPAGFENFEPTPRAYLNPVGGGIATEVRAVSYLGTSQVDGVVPEGLPPGEYQLVVVNPDGDVGLLSAPTFRVLPVTDPPPVVTELVPGLANDAPGQAITINGQNFPADPLDVQVTADCRDPSGQGANQAVTAVVDSTTDTAIATTWDMGGLSGYVCVVRVSNTANSTYVDFSAISVTNPSNNLNDFLDSLPMVEPRRAAAGAAVRLNAQSRFLFAIGGDQGDDGVNPVVRHSSVESVPIDPFGALSGNWTIQRNALPDARSFISSAVVGRHVYIAGGRTGDAPGVVDNNVYRAYLLDPFEAPVIRDLDLNTSAGTGLDAGIWYYRVAAVMGPDDSNNPNGEGLASEPLVIQLPFSQLDLTLFWPGIDGAVKYIVYRTPAPNGISGQEVFLAEVDHVGGATDVQSFTDDGSLDNTAETRTPLPPGSLGVWHSIGTLATEREGAAIVAVPDPLDSGRQYLYVIGGRDSTGTAVATYEWTTLAIQSPAIQTYGNFQVGAETLANGRWQIGAVYVDASRGPVGAGQVFVYVLPGIDGTGGSVADVTAFPVDVADGTGNDNGALGTPVAVASNNPLFAGYAYVAGNNFLHMIGGQTGVPHNGGRKAPITGAPTLGNWANGTNLFTPRYLHATARESAFIFLLGGETSTELASRTTERTNF